jgi:general stress protein YciG
MNEEVVKKPHGFALLSPEQRKEISAKGGRAVRSTSRFFARNPHIASQAGKKGGKLVAPEKRPFSRDRELARRAGSMGGKAASKKPVSVPVDLEDLRYFLNK